MKPFTFSVQAAGIASREAWRSLAVKAEDLGYGSLTMADHIDGDLAIVPALMAAADATRTLRIGSTVFANDFRHPALLAREIATLDVLSGGRFEWGMGAGWMQSDYDRAGLTHDPAGTRIERLEEAIVLMKALFAEGPVSHRGAHYTVTELDGTPKPAQRPHPPLLIGGGARRILSVAGRHADIVGINPSLAAGVIDDRAGPTATATATDAKVRWARESAGARAGDLEFQTRIHLAMVSDDAAGVAAALGPALGMSPSEAMASPHALVGTIDEMVEALEERRARWGISHITWGSDMLEPMASVVARLSGT